MFIMDWKFDRRRRRRIALMTYIINGMCQFNAVSCIQGHLANLLLH